MAKRKRLTPANPAFMEPAPEAKSAFPAPMRAPIADVAREASQAAAVEEMAETLRAAREGGRMVIAVPLEEVAEAHLVRDRVSVPPEEQAALEDSIARRGQQTPVELVDLGAGQSPRYGLISGWRRLQALKALRARDARFGEVLGLLRKPAEASAAYLAMIEENEIRLGLSYYERARIALKAVEAEAFEDVQQALVALYEGASRAKRSKIKSFMTLVAELDGVLRFPAQIGERLGLQLAQALEADGTLAARLAQGIAAGDPQDFEAEQGLIRAELTPPRPKAARPAPEASPLPAAPRAPVHVRPQGAHQVLLEGRGVDADFLKDLEAWIAARQG
ncbi:MAG: ParB N-terminal domain-containing protein [Flavobacteriaceae bacterium]|nr:ParB N-terminal domain-containing protein [Flavobacteriaceae bacterium]